MKRFGCVFPVLVTVLATPVWGQPVDREGPPAGPQLGVARVSLADGDVTVRHSPSAPWTQVRSGRPLIAGDSIATGRSSRAEVQLGPGNSIRLGANTELFMGELGHRRYQVRLTKGIATYSELKNAQADTEIDTPQVIVRPLKTGVYRFEVLDAEQTAVAVRKGETEISSSGGTQKLKQGRRMVVRGDQPDPEFRVAKANPRDSFDNWNNRRDQLLKEDRRGPHPGFWGPHHLGFGFGYGFGPWGFGGPRGGFFYRTGYRGRRK